MKISQSREGDALLLRLHGRILIGESAQAFREVLTSALDAPDNQGVILDMSGVDHVDSTGLGELVGHLSLFKNAGKRLLIRNPAPRIMALIRLAKLDTFLPIENPPA